MARTNTLPNFLTDVADAIREKKGTEETIQASDFDTEIASISGGGSTPTKGFTITEWDNDGYAKEIKFYGLSKIPASAFKFSSAWGLMLSKIESYDFNNVVTDIGMGGLFQNTQLTEVKNWGSLTKIERNGFSYCSKFNPKVLPDSLTYLDEKSFSECSGITQISMKNVINLMGASSDYGAFYNCKNLKAVWIGSSIGTTQRYIFQGCTNLSKIFIDLPRARVQNLGGYSYAFMNDTSKTGIIVCNDDTGFITKEEFDAIDWSTQ